MAEFQPVTPSSEARGRAHPPCFTDPAELTGAVISAAIAVHRSLGPGFLESTYEEALCIELGEVGISFERQKVIPIFHRKQQVGEHRLDLLVEKRLILELKACASLEKVHFAVVRSYMKASGTDLGLLLNFSSMPLTIRRVAPERNNKKQNFSGNQGTEIRTHE